MPTIYHRGLQVYGSVDYDPGQRWPSYSCGGVPPSTDVEIDEILIDDAEEFLMTGIISDLADDRKWRNGMVQLLEAYHRITGELLPEVERYVLATWGDDIEDALIDAYHEAPYE